MGLTPAGAVAFLNEALGFLAVALFCLALGKPPLGTDPIRVPTQPAWSRPSALTRIISVRQRLIQTGST